MDLQTLLGHVHTHIQPSNLKIYQDLAQAAQSVSTDASTQDLIVVLALFTPSAKLWWRYWADRIRTSISFLCTGHLDKCDCYRFGQ